MADKPIMGRTHISLLSKSWILFRQSLSPNIHICLEIKSNSKYYEHHQFQNWQRTVSDSVNWAKLRLLHIRLALLPPPKNGFE